MSEVGNANRTKTRVKNMSRKVHLNSGDTLPRVSAADESEQYAEEVCPRTTCFKMRDVASIGRRAVVKVGRNPTRLAVAKVDDSRSCAPHHLQEWVPRKAPNMWLHSWPSDVRMR